MTAWWITGTRDQLFFYVLQRTTMHGEVRLHKLNGELQDAVSLCCGVRVVATSCFYLRLIAMMASTASSYRACVLHAR